MFLNIWVDILSRGKIFFFSFFISRENQIFRKKRKGMKRNREGIEMVCEPSWPLFWDKNSLRSKSFQLQFSFAMINAKETTHPSDEIQTVPIFIFLEIYITLEQLRHCLQIVMWYLILFLRPFNLFVLDRAYQLWTHIVATHKSIISYHINACIKHNIKW